MRPIVIIMTTGNDRNQLESMAAALVRQRLAACAQVGSSITSWYRWRGAVESAEEWTLTVKTTADLMRDACSAIQRYHSYEVPEIIAIRPHFVEEPYLQWVLEQVSAPRTPAQWHVFVHGAPPHYPARSSEFYRDKWPTLAVSPTELREPMPIDFDLLCNRFRTELGAYCEPDGAFGWHPQFGMSAAEGDSVDERTSLNGTIHCADQRVMGVEVFGRMRREDWTRLRSLLEGFSPIIVQWVEAGVFVDAETFASMLAEDREA